MPAYKATINVTLRSSILDPQGKAIEMRLHSLGYESVTGVRMGKSIVLDIEAEDESKAEVVADELCKKLLANPVMEDYKVSILAS